jgi:hypothetical protein
MSRSEKARPVAEVQFGDVVKVGFRLPVILGELKPGDKVAVQILYTPDALELVRAPGAEPADEMLMEMSLALRGDVARVPLLSNRFEFEIFEDLIAPKEEPAAK